MEALRKRLRQGSKWTDATVQDLFDNLGLQQWWIELNNLEAKGRVLDRSEWRERVRVEWKKRYPAIPAPFFEGMINSLDKIEEDSRQTRSLATRVSIVDKENQATTHLKPTVSNYSIPVNIFPHAPDELQRSVPPSIMPPKMAAKLLAADAAKVDPTDFSALQKQVTDLDIEVNRTTQFLKQKMASLESQVGDDSVAIADLKWRLNEISEGDEKAQVGGKRSYRKAKDKVPSHRYPTCSSKVQDDVVLEALKKDVERIEQRITVLEGRVEGLLREIEELRAELVRAEALAPKIDALASSLLEFRESQAKFNLSSLQEFARIKTLYSDTIEPRLNAQALDLVNLNAHYNMLHALTAHLVGPAAMNRACSAFKTSTTSPSRAQNRMTKNPLSLPFSPLSPLRQIAPV